MLVLARKVEQKIRIGENIVITVLKVSHDQVSLGIEAPKDELILREELSKRVAKTNRSSLITPGQAEELPTIAAQLNHAD